MLRAAYVVGATAAELAAAGRQFPALALLPVVRPPRALPEVSGATLFGPDAWRRDLELGRALASREALVVMPKPYGLTAVLTRYQRFGGRLNGASRGATFARVLARHRALHDLTKPLVQADFDHARDVWQWLLRLWPAASQAAQVAALFHDVERLTSEAERRIEHQATDYDRFKAAHARAGGARLRALLAGDLDGATLDRAATLVATHEVAQASGYEGECLAEADALSFFSLNSPGFIDYYGPVHTRKKVAWTLARLGPRGRAQLPKVALRDDIRALLSEEES